MFGPELLAQLAKLKEATDMGMANLPDRIVEGSSGNGLVKVKMDGMYQLKDLKIAIDIKLMEMEDLEDYLALAINDAVVKVNKIREEELTLGLTQLMQKP